MMACAPVMVLPSCSVWLPGPNGRPSMARCRRAIFSSVVIMRGMPPCLRS